jgi:hypothetical protein
VLRGLARAKFWRTQGWANLKRGHVARWTPMALEPNMGHIVTMVIEPVFSIPSAHRAFPQR